MLFSMLVSFVTGMTVVATVQEGWHASNNIVMFIVMVEIYLNLCLWSFVNDTIKMFLGYNINLYVFHYLLE